MEPCPGTDDEPVNSLWVRIRGQMSATDCLIRKKMWLSSDKGKKPHVQKPWFSWGT